MDKIYLDSGQGVELAITVAGVGARSYAFVIDWHIRFLLAFVWVMAFFLISDIDGLWWDADSALFDSSDSVYQWFILLVVLPPTIIYFLYHPILEILMHGQTPGKRITGVRIVRQDGMPASIAQHLIRNIFRLIDSMPVCYCFGLTCCLLNSQQLRVGDLAAGTVLVYVDHNTKRAVNELNSVLTENQLNLEQNQLLQEIIERWPKLEKENQKIIAGEFLISTGHLNQNQLDHYSELELFEMLQEHAK